MWPRRDRSNARCHAMVVGIFTFFASDLCAAQWLPYNLDTLVTISDSIVLAENLGRRSVADSRDWKMTLIRYRIQKVYKTKM